MATFREYKRPLLFFSQHIETIFPAVVRRVTGVRYERERIVTSDDDFLDLDWVRSGNRRLAILSHGLEGNSTRAYVTGMARALNAHGFDVLAWNFRGCSDEMNRRLNFYHSGATNDLQTVVDHCLKTYAELVLVGFSLGGNLTLKYLGERTVPPAIRRAVAFSVPLDLHSSCLRISRPGNFIYSRRFVRHLKEKILRKASTMRDLDVTGIDAIKTLIDFDDRYTAPLHGFSNAIDYYTRCSAKPFLRTIAVPTLIVNAQNDPFLSKACYPTPDEIQNDRVTFEAPRYGGHVGFAQFSKNQLYWSEERALAFLLSND